MQPRYAHSGRAHPGRRRPPPARDRIADRLKQRVDLARRRGAQERGKVGIAARRRRRDQRRVTSEAIERVDRRVQVLGERPPLRSAPSGANNPLIDIVGDQ